MIMKMEGWVVLNNGRPTATDTGSGYQWVPTLPNHVHFYTEESADSIIKAYDSTNNYGKFTKAKATFILEVKE